MSLKTLQAAYLGTRATDNISVLSLKHFLRVAYSTASWDKRQLREDMARRESLGILSGRKKG